MLILKLVHVSCAALSFSGFVLRGVWMLRGSRLLQARLTRVLPHIVDTVLLGSATLLALRIGQYPFVHGWLTAKVLGLVLYIGLGSVALKYGKTRAVRGLAWVAALTVFLYIVAVAMTHSASLGVTPA